MDLPKWPRVKIVGDRIDPNKAKELILRSDQFLTSLGMHYSGGNDHNLVERYRRLVGLFGEELESESQAYEVLTAYRRACVSTQYIHNDWASCSYIEGPYGWVSPRGEIAFDKNVGKWPSLEEIVGDLTTIAAHIDFKAYVTDGEYCEDSRVVAAYEASNGIVTRVSCDLAFPSRETILTNLDTRQERGIPLSWIDEAAKTARDWIATNHPQYPLHKPI